MTLWIVAAAAVGAVVALVALNLSFSERKIEHEIRPLYAVGDDQFIRSMGALLGPGIVGGNRVASLLNGDQIFPAMLQAISAASCTTPSETYIYRSGEIGRKCADAPCERARAGVRVHVLLDWLGTG
jgi:cardiolipin synthase